VQAIVRRLPGDGPEDATRLFPDLAKGLEDEYPNAAGSVCEQLDDTLTVLTL
jgi:hypothetical protein